MPSNPPLSVARPATSSVLAVGLLALGACGSPGEPTAANSDTATITAAPDPIVGSWRPRAYRLEGGEELPVDGRIVFVASREDGGSGEWFVAFFVIGEDGSTLRGSAEGGEWSRDGRSLLLTHQYHLSAGEAAGPLPAAPLAMALRSAAEAADNHREPCEVTVDENLLTLFFPSGNSMTFERVEGLR